MLILRKNAVRYGYIVIPGKNVVINHYQQKKKLFSEIKLCTKSME